MDGYFPAPLVDKRVPLVAQLVADTIVEHGYAEVHGVPGDQQATLRRAVRARVRELTGHASRTLVRGSTVMVTCPALYAAHEAEYAHAAAEAIEEVLGPGKREPRRPRGVPDWVVAWDAWDLG